MERAKWTHLQLKSKSHHTLKAERVREDMCRKPREGPHLKKVSRGTERERLLGHALFHGLHFTPKYEEKSFKVSLKTRSQQKRGCCYNVSINKAIELKFQPILFRFHRFMRIFEKTHLWFGFGQFQVLEDTNTSTGFTSILAIFNSV